MKSFEGKVVLVSGASSGIGEAAAVQFERAGAVVYGLASGAASRDAAAGRHPGVRWLAANLARRAEIDAAVARVVGEAGRLDVLINNAGIYQFAPVEATGEAMVRDQFEVNVFGLIFLTQAALPALERSRGTIVNVSSTSAHKALPNQSVYGATKAAVESLTRAWAGEFGPRGVRVNAISPGPTMTDGVAKLPLPEEAREALIKQVLKAVPLGRMATSEEVARWLLIAADPSVTWLTGQVIGIDGGMSVT